MAVLKIDVPLFKRMVMNGAINLKNNHQEIDELNVFPVPDGDTGTNMQMTVMGGVREMDSCQSTSIIEVSKTLSRGCLMGARGNSGVILSQFFRGVHVGIKALNDEPLSIKDFANVLVEGYKVAYKAVMEPVEGTILTVVREAGEATLAAVDTFKSIDDLVKFYLAEARKSLENTPNLLPVLKEAGVVDSGGAGFIKIVEGMLMALEGNILEAVNTNGDKKSADGSQDTKEVEIKFGYCTEFILELKNPQAFIPGDIKSPLSLLGDSLVCVHDDNLLKIHVHTNKPGRVLELAQEYGEFKSVKIENMRLQHSELVARRQEEPKKEFALIAVCSGSGISDTFKSLGVDYVIEGGQTMNPSTETFVTAIKELNAKNVIIIPNNSNIVMAAEQAANICTDVNVGVLKTKTIAQGYASLMAYNPGASLEENVEEMTAALKKSASGEVTYSIRDTELNGVKINSGDFIGILNGKIVVSEKDRLVAVETLVKQMINDESEIITVFAGSDATEEEIDNVLQLIGEIAPEIDVELIEGKQEIYTYIICVE